MKSMPDRVIPVIIILIMSLSWPAFSQGPAPKAVTPSVPEAAGAAASAPEKMVNVEVSDGLLSLELVDADFGEVMKAIAEQSGIKVTMSGDVQSRKLNTRFRGLDLERGIARIMTLIDEKNYTFKYDKDGKIELIEVYAISASPPAPGKTPSRPETPKFRTPIPAAPVRTPAQPPAPPRSPAPAIAPRSGPAVVPKDGPSFVPKGSPTGVQKNPPIQKRLLTPPVQTQDETKDTQNEIEEIEEAE